MVNNPDDNPPNSDEESFVVNWIKRVPGYDQDIDMAANNYLYNAFDNPRYTITHNMPADVMEEPPEFEFYLEIRGK